MKPVSTALVLAASLAMASSLAACAGSAPAGSASSNCSPAHKFSTIQSGKLTVSVYVTQPYTDNAPAGAPLGGVDGKIINKIAEAECLSIVPAYVDASTLINSVATKRADVAIGGLYYTEERNKVVTLSDTVYRDGMAILSKSGLASLEQLRGKSTGVIQGYLWNKELQDALGSDHVKLYQDATSLMADLDAGRVDAGILAGAEGAYRAKKSSTGLKSATFEPNSEVPTSTKPGNVILAMTKGNDDMAKAFNENIRKLIADGTMGEILKSEGIDPQVAGKG